MNPTRNGKIGVVVLADREAAKIDRAINSLKMQRDVSCEIIGVALEKFPNPAAALNHGVSLLGDVEYLFMLDHDGPLIIEDALFLMTSALSELSEMSFVYGREVIDAGQAQAINGSRPFSAMLLGTAPYIPNCVMVRSEYWVGYDEQFERGHEYDMLLEMVENYGAKGMLIPKVMRIVPLAPIREYHGDMDLIRRIHQKHIRICPRQIKQ